MEEAEEEEDEEEGVEEEEDEEEGVEEEEEEVEQGEEEELATIVVEGGEMQEQELTMQAKMMKRPSGSTLPVQHHHLQLQPGVKLLAETEEEEEVVLEVEEEEEEDGVEIHLLQSLTLHHLLLEKHQELHLPRSHQGEMAVHFMESASLYLQCTINKHIRLL